jgi:hypothetical protein
MNIALEKTEEYVNGVKRRSYGDAFVRGNNGQWLFLLFSVVCFLTHVSHVHLGRLSIGSHGSTQSSRGGMTGPRLRRAHQPVAELPLDWMPEESSIWCGILGAWKSDAPNPRATF